MEEKRETTKKSVAAWLRPVAVLAFWLAVWMLLAALVNKELWLPRPELVIGRLLELMGRLDFWRIAASTLLRILAGFALGMLAGSALAVLMRYSAIATALLAPVVKLIRATPVASFIILALVWIDKPQLPIFISLLMVLPVAWANLSSGLDDMDGQMLEMAALYKVGRWRNWRRIYFPSLHPYLLSAAVTGLGLAWKSGVTAEVIAGPRLAIGSQLQTAKVNLESADVFAWTLVVVILSMLLEKVLIALMKKGKARYARGNSL